MTGSHTPVRIAVLLLLLAGAGASDLRAQAVTDHAPTQAKTAPTWLSFGEAIDRAAESGKMVLVDVWSARCGWCAKMQKEVYTQSDLLAYLDKHFETGRLDIDVRSDTIAYMGYKLSSAELSVAFGASGTPTAVFLTSDGSYITRLPGYQPYESFIEVLRFIGSESFREMRFEEYQGRDDASGR